MRTRSQANALRPWAIERARHSKFKEGDRVLLPGLGRGEYLIILIVETKPYRSSFVFGASGHAFDVPLGGALPVASSTRLS